MTAEQRVTRLPNGLRIATEPMADAASVCVGIWVGAGARAEAEREHGVAHLLEHMAFKGTRRRSARAIAEEIEAVGGDINAATGMEQTSYVARVLPADLALGLDVLADIVTDSVLDPAELAREQGVIVQEIAAVKDTPDDLVFDLLQEASFTDQPLGRSILGTVESVRGFDRDAVAGFLARHYAPDRMVVAATGAVDHDAFVALATAALGSRAGVAAADVAPAAFRAGDRRDQREAEQVNLAFGLPGVGYADERVFAAQVFAGLLGGGMASRLFQEVREKRGLAYTVSAFHWAYAETGLFGIHVGAAEDDLDELVPVLCDELEAAAEGADEAEVARAKAQLKAGLLMSLESSGARAERLARRLLVFDRLIPVEEIVQRIEAVDVHAVRAQARAMLGQGQLALAAVGPVERLAPASEIARRWRAAPGRSA